MRDNQIEELLCEMLENVEFSQIIKVKDHQDKKCEFLESKVSFRVQDIVEKDPTDGEDIEITIPCLSIENISYEEGQGKFKFSKL